MFNLKRLLPTLNSFASALDSYIAVARNANLMLIGFPKETHEFQIILKGSH